MRCNGVPGVNSAATPAGSVLRNAVDMGFDVASRPVTPHDLQATVLHLLGMNHLRLTYRSQGRDFRLTDVFGNLVQGIIA